MEESRTVTLSAGANAVVKEIALKLNVPFEEALSVAIGTQAQILRQTKAGNRVSIDPDGTTIRVTLPK